MVDQKTIQNILIAKPLNELKNAYTEFDLNNFLNFKIPTVTVHGRFQPPLYINYWNYISNAFCIADKVIILITNPNFGEVSKKEAPHRNKIENNPFTYDQRIEIFKAFFNNLGIPQNKYEFRPFDITDENSWGTLDKEIPNFINTYGEWIQAKLEKFKNLNLKVIHSNVPRLMDISGSKIREILREDIPFEDKKSVLIKAGYMEDAIPGLFEILNRL